MLDPFIDQMLQNIKMYKSSWSMTTTTEIEFLKQILANHGNTLDETTTFALLEFFAYVYLHHPYIGKFMGLGEQIAKIVADNREVSNEICNYVQVTLLPQLLGQVLALKKLEQIKSSQSPNPRLRGKSPKPGSKGQKLLNRKKEEQEADLKVKRYNIINLVERLYRALDGTKYQDTIIEQVKEVDTRY